MGISNSDTADLIGRLPLSLPDSARDVERRFRQRLEAAVIARSGQLTEFVNTLLEDGMLIEGLKADSTELDKEELASLAEAIAAHATPIFYPERIKEQEEQSTHYLFANGLRDLVKTPPSLCAPTDHADDLETAARLLRAEELLAEVKSLVAPILNNRDERRSLNGAANRYTFVLKELWATQTDEVAERPRTPRRREWMANLLDIVNHHWTLAAQKRQSNPPTKQRIAEVTSHIAKLLGIEKPPTPEGLRQR